MQHLVDQLVHAGLSEREAKVYLVSLSLGEANVQEIAHATQIMRTTVYNVIDGLVEHGLMKSVERKGKKFYIAESPEHVVTMLKSKADALLKRMESLEESLPEFMAVENKHKDRPRVYYFEGKEGIKQLSRRYEEVSGDFFEIAPYDKIREFFGEHEFDSHKETLTKNRIHGRIIIIADKPPVEFMRRMHQRFGWEIRYMEPSVAPMDGHMSVKGSEVYGFSYEGVPMGVLIENPALASAMHRVFEMAWESAPTDIAFP